MTQIAYGIGFPLLGLQLLFGYFMLAPSGSGIDASTIKSLPCQSPRFEAFTRRCMESQQNMINFLDSLDGGSLFSQSPWDRYDSDGTFVGHGITAVIEKGDLIEKGAASTTFLTGKLTPQRAASMSERLAKKKLTNPSIYSAVNGATLEGRSYFAAAFSIVLHSRSPMVPTFRADVRYFELEDMDGWFGGGADLTPYYLFDDDAIEFHSRYRALCGQYAPSQFYNRLKRWCDEYFYIPSRGEHRGIGGIFFDDLVDEDLLDDTDRNTNSNSSNAGTGSSTTSGSRSMDKDGGLDKAMEFTLAVCDSFVPAYESVVRKRRHLPYTEAQRHWQLLRRGRYVEFNLIYDRGVRFGLLPVEQGDRRTEAVLVSCPPLVAWDYNYVPAVGSEEERLLGILKTPVDW